MCSELKVSLIIRSYQTAFMCVYVCVRACMHVCVCMRALCACVHDFCYFLHGFYVYGIYKAMSLLRPYL